MCWIHPSFSTPVQAAPDVFLAAADVNGCIYIMSIARFRVVALLKGHNHPVTFLDSRSYTSSDDKSSNCCLMSFSQKESTVKVWKLDEIITKAILNPSVTADGFITQPNCTISVSRICTHAV